MVTNQQTNIAKEFRYFRFENGMEIIAPLKCGTRFMDIQRAYPISSTYHIHFDELKKNLHKDVIFIWRDVVEHMLSGLVTDFALNSKYTTLTKLSKQYVNGLGTHWKPSVYQNLYPIWNKIGFKFVELKNLSSLFENTFHDPIQFDHKNLIGIKDLNEIKNSIPKDTLDTLIDMANTENVWLGRMVRGEKDVVTLSDWNELKRKYDELLIEYRKLKVL